jgi:hypothetical protein
MPLGATFVSPQRSPTCPKVQVQKKKFFFVKIYQKTSARFRRRRRHAFGPEAASYSKSFLVLFFKKELLAYP